MYGSNSSPSERQKSHISNILSILYDNIYLFAYYMISIFLPMLYDNIYLFAYYMIISNKMEPPNENHVRHRHIIPHKWN